MHSFLRKCAGVMFRARRWIMVGWLIVVIAGGALFGRLPDLLSSGGWQVEGATSKVAGERLASEFAGRSGSSLTLVVRNEAHSVDSPEYSEQLRQMTDRLKQEESVKDVFSLLDASEASRPALVGKDPHMSLAMVELGVDEDQAVALMPKLQESVQTVASALSIEAHLVGTAAFEGEGSVQSQKGLSKAEMIVMPLMLIILLLVFRSIAAAVTPLIVTMASVMTAMGIIYLVARQVELSVFVTNSAMMLGLGVGIDYSLFVVNRFRLELERHPGGSVVEALKETMATAGHTVFFSALTVIAALSALFVVPLPAIRAIAFGGIAVVFVAGTATLTLLPAILGSLGARINWGRVPFLRNRASTSTAEGRWSRWTRSIMRRPVLYLLLTLGLMGALALPATNLKLYYPDLRMLPADTGVRQGFTLLEESFGRGATSPVSIVLHHDSLDWHSPDALALLGEAQQEAKTVAHVVSSASALDFVPGHDPVLGSKLLQPGGGLPADVQKLADRFISRDGHSAVIEVSSDQYGSSDEAQEMVQSLQQTIRSKINWPNGISVDVGGETMSGVDTSGAIHDSLLPALSIMLVLIFVILVFSFRSLLLPLKAILLNLLSVATTYGVLILVMGKGYGSELFGVEANGSIVNFVPILLLALLFGLSTDYEVFLVSRIKEEHDRGRSHEDSIVEGVERTGPLITGAAVLMFAVFTGFAFSGVLPIQMLGFGMAVAIALDATVVRLLLVPVTMKLLGRLSWWFPVSSQRDTKIMRKRIIIND